MLVTLSASTNLESNARLHFGLLHGDELMVVDVGGELADDSSSQLERASEQVCFERVSVHIEQLVDPSQCFERLFDRQGVVEYLHVFVDHYMPQDADARFERSSVAACSLSQRMLLFVGTSGLFVSWL